MTQYLKAQNLTDRLDIEHFRPADQTLEPSLADVFISPFTTGDSAPGGDLHLSEQPMDAVVENPLPDRDAVKNETFYFRIPDGTFAGSSPFLSYAAVMADDTQLPSWLTFDPISGVFQGTPPTDYTGEFDVKVYYIDGDSEASDVFHLRVRDTNETPVGAAIADQVGTEDQPWTFQLPAGTFSDADSPDLNYNAHLAGGMPLPTWLHFDPHTLTFSGTPPQDFYGDVNLEVIADDGSRMATSAFTLTITGTPDAPVVANPLQDRYALEDAPIDFVIPYQTFSDPDGDTLTYTATLEDGSPLPAWLSFDPATQRFSGTPPANYFGDLGVTVVASDGTHATPETFDIDVLPVNDAPVLAHENDDQRVKPGKHFSYQVGADTFTDVDDTTLSYTATRADGSALPAWLHFDSATGTFSGKAPASFSAPIYVKLVASDGVSSATDEFVLASNTPFLATHTEDQTVGRGAWTFKVPDGTFKDFDTTNLTYTATLQDGSALPDWLSFDGATRTFSGTPPIDWDGHEDLRVTASDGAHTAEDDFSVIKKGDLSWHLSGSMWGRDAPSEIHYRFDKLYFQSSNSWEGGFSGGFSEGPIYGGVSGSLSTQYAIQAGLLADFQLKPDLFNLDMGINIHEQGASNPGQTPFVTVTGKMDNHTAFSAMTPDDAFLLHAFAGITASASATVAGGVYGGFATPDIDLGFTTIDIPDITFDAGFSATIPLPSIAPITISDGQFTKPDGATGAIDVNIKTGDAPVTLNLDEDGIGHITIGPPTGINLSDFDVANVQPSGLGTLHIGGVSTPFLGASLDLDALAIHAVPELEPLFHDVLNYDFGGFQVGGKLDSDFALTGDLSFREDAYFTPQIFCDFTTSFGETLTHVDASTPTGFTTPEGEGTFTVNGSYTSEADFTTVISLVANIHFDFTLLKASLFAHVGEGPIGFDLLGLDLPAAYSGTLSMANLTIPIFSNTDHYVLGQTFSDTFVLAYEKFRTTFGSGDNFTMTTNQTFADGNQNANHLVGNLLSDTITGAGGGDTLEGLAGGDLLNGEDGDDTVIGGGGLDTLLGGAGDDLIIGGANGNSIDGGDGDDSITSGARADSILGGAGNDHISGGNGDNTIDGGDGNDTIFSGKGDDVITDLSGVVNITDTGGDNTFIFGDQGVTFTYLLGNTHITSGSGDDVLTTGGGSDNIRTGDGANVVNAGDGANVVIAGAGADQITTGGGADFIKAYGGADIVNAGDGANTVLGMDGSDSLTGGAGADYMDGGRGNDTLVGGDGNNSLYGEEGNDVLIAGAGADSLLGQYGRDRLFGGDGRDFISGGAAADTITGGLGADTLVGDTGNDRFVYHGVAESNGAGYDDLADFNVRMDALDLDVTVSAIGHTRSGDLALASFDLDLQHLLRGERLPMGQAVVVKASGELAGHVYLVVDANGLAGYQTGQDYVFELDPTASTHFTTADFI